MLSISIPHLNQSICISKKQGADPLKSDPAVRVALKSSETLTVKFLAQSQEKLIHSHLHMSVLSERLRYTY